MGPRTVITVAALAGLSCVVTLPDAALAQTVHRLEAGPSTVAFGHYDPAKPGVLRIQSGDIVEVTTMLTSNPTRLQSMGLPAAEVQPELAAIYDEVTDRGPGGHILTGPIHVEGARPGDVLEVRILSVGFSVPYGYNGCSGFVRDLCDPDRRSRLIRIDTAGSRAEIAPGITVPLRPFFGSMGVAPPPDSGRVSSNPPGRHAGNMDNKELVAGTALFIPVWVEGARFEVGDGHAIQGDGEVNQTGLETSLEGRLQFFVHRGLSLDWPRAETPTHHILMGFDPDLEKATEIAIRETVEFLQERTGLSSGEAYSVVSMAVDLRITELVDGNVGVHAMVPKTLLAGETRPGAEPLPPTLQAVLDRWSEQEGHMGISVAVVLPDGGEWQGTAGIEAEGRPMEVDHMMAVASITKTATGAVVMQLAEEGVLHLDDPVGRWLDSVPNVDPAITLRQLLNHTSGVANYTRHADHWPEATSDFSRRYAPREVMERWVGAPSFAAGARTEYTNTAFVLLGMVAEAATGQPVAELYRERLWAPLGLEEVFLLHAEPVRGRVATSWVGSNPSALQPMDPLQWVSPYTTRYSAFGLVASARDVARWARALFTGDVLSESMRAEMLTSVPAAGNIPAESGVGLGVRRYLYLDREQWGHSGGAPEGSSIVVYDPETGITLSILMNQGGGGHRASHFRLAPELLALAAEASTEPGAGRPRPEVYSPPSGGMSNGWLCSMSMGRLSSGSAFASASASTSATSPGSSA